MTYALAMLPPISVPLSAHEVGLGPRTRACSKRAPGFLALLLAVTMSACAAPRTLVATGSSAPHVEGVDHRGTRWHAADPGAGELLVYFYPRDATPGCTKEACALRDAWASYEELGVTVLGVSNDDLESHREFATEHALPFGLIADTEGHWARAFGVPAFAGLYKRVSFLLSADRRILAVYEDVDPGVHAREVLDEIRRIRGEGPAADRPATPR